ncbi:Outer membrane protein beta-barrel domain-containing protein [Paenimyroides ummariense]|uniref:Outer membrane protein beta-barrel domain-containing protein n=1 Tax=Paenimyroides ummariense TaxID=913024 RepID=A0A1I5D2D2_9FLAO|nr:outer membrane beta-barrel protein [Paenimyroides ummariense]SFN93400.1 Outer membrane protein beta-barrel domain-containing protein [Paenimyroides ummariense]
MKKTLFIALMASFTVNAQVREKGEVEVSPFIGVSTANYFGDVGMMNEAVVNPYFGANLDLYFNNRWSLKTGVEYQTMGSQGESYGFYGFESFEEKINFVSVPIHANYHFSKNRRWYLNFGPTINFLTEATSNGMNMKEGITPVQLGLGLGIGYKIYVNERFSIGIDHQEYIGFTNNLKSKYNNNDLFIGNYFGSFSVKAIFKLGSSESEK